MKITLVMVQSVNGKITRGTDPHVPAWTSAEDSVHFHSMLEAASLIIMGRHTYEAAKSSIKHKEGTLRIVITTHPDAFEGEAKTGILEFTDESPDELIRRLERQEFAQALLVGGATLNSAFLSSELVDDIYLTIEPRIFGTGRPLIEEANLDLKLKLLDSKKLNDKGTLLLHYQVDCAAQIV